jgi:hypothetical protein
VFELIRRHMAVSRDFAHLRRPANRAPHRQRRCALWAARNLLISRAFSSHASAGIGGKVDLSRRRSGSKTRWFAGKNRGTRI